MSLEKNKKILDDIIELPKLRLIARQIKDEMDEAERKYIEMSEPKSPNNPDKVKGNVDGDPKLNALSYYHDLKTEYKHFNYRITKAHQKKASWMQQCPEQDKDFLWDVMSGKTFVHIGETYGYERAQHHLDSILRKLK